MSLYIGNLSPRVQQEELERLFGRFGRCTIKLKDGYGFAVYGIRAQAEVAIRALRGRNICGLPISLSWSNKQPNARQPFNRGSRPFEMQSGRGFMRRDDHMNGPLRPNARPPYQFRHPDGNPRRLESNELHVEKGSFDTVYKEQEHNSQKEDGQDKTDNVDPNLSDSGRWGEQIGRISNDSHIDDGSTFDRYEPDAEQERIDLEANNAAAHDMSPGKEISEDRFRREEVVDVALGPRNSPRKNQACFKCGNLGHKMRDCLLQDASRKRKLDRSEDRRGNAVNTRHRGRLESEGVEPSSRRRLSSTSTKERGRGKKDSGSGRRERSKRRKSSLVSTEYNDHGKAHGRRKRSEDGKENFKDRHGKRTRRSLSRSRSRSSSTSSSRSSSISRSSGSYSSSSLMSDSKSNQPKSGRVKSRYKTSSSSPTSLSLSASLGQPLTPPPNKTEVKLNGTLDISKNLPTKPDVMQEGQGFDVFAEEDSIGCQNTGVDVQSNLALVKESQQTEVALKEGNIASGDTGVVVQDEDTDVCVDVQDDSKIDNLQDNDDKYLTDPRIPFDGNGVQHTTSLEKQHGTGVSHSQIFREDSEAQTLGMETYLPLKLDSKIASSTRAKHTSISLEELDRVVKHYNLKHTEENVGHLSTEEYFGCARMWPWEIIYYRRLKKGPISVENYARRLAQNKEFGITDKYVRSSSGWGEPTQEDLAAS